MNTQNTQKTFAVDFDGVIHRYSEGWKDGTIYDEPKERAAEAIMKLMKNGAVYIFTTRKIDDVVRWMNGKFWGEGERGFITIAMPEGIDFWDGSGGVFGQKVAVSNRKLPSEIYIDDRGYKFENWEKTLKDLSLK